MKDNTLERAVRNLRNTMDPRKAKRVANILVAICNASKSSHNPTTPRRRRICLKCARITQTR